MILNCTQHLLSSRHIPQLVSTGAISCLITAGPQPPGARSLEPGARSPGLGLAAWGVGRLTPNNTAAVTVPKSPPGSTAAGAGGPRAGCGPRAGGRVAAGPGRAGSSGVRSIGGAGGGKGGQGRV